MIRIVPYVRKTRLYSPCKELAHRWAQSSEFLQTGTRDSCQIRFKW